MTTFEVIITIATSSVGFGILTAIGSLLNMFRKNMTNQRLALQALLRAQLISDYNRYKEQGWAPIYAKENFENCYQRYHNLGQNGVMDGIRSEFLELPTHKPAEE